MATLPGIPTPPSGDRVDPETKKFLGKVREWMTAAASKLNATQFTESEVTQLRALLKKNAQ